MSEEVSTMNGRILLIDDDFYISGLYKKMLERRGFTVELNDGVDAALTSLTNPEKQFDLIVLDLAMPPGKSLTKEESLGGVASGVAVYKKIRERSVKLPVIVLTNVVQNSILSMLHEVSSERLAVLFKVDCDPVAFPDFVLNMLSETQPAGS
jgi:CheY-like chemotaxis protein